MINSGALPNVTLSRAPSPGPERAASSSVARPISAAVGITPSADAANTATASACTNSSRIATGINGTSRYGQPSPVSRNGLGRSVADVTALVIVSLRQFVREDSLFDGSRNQPGLTAARTSAAVSDGVFPTLTPMASSAVFFAEAVPDDPDTIAPACPMVLPSGAVNPAM